MNHDLWPRVHCCPRCGVKSNASVCAACLIKDCDKPLKPRKPQEPCDIGLFSDDADQTDLIEMLMD